MRHIYEGIEIENGFQVLMDGKNMDPRPSLALENHSPDGLAWGYNGSGPTQLALAILLHETDRATARAAYMRFREQVVSLLPAEGFLLSSADVQEWLDHNKLPGRKLPDVDVNGLGLVLMTATRAFVRDLPPDTGTVPPFALIGPSPSGRGDMDLVHLDSAFFTDMEGVCALADLLATAAAEASACGVGVLMTSRRADQAMVKALGGKIPPNSPQVLSLTMVGPHTQKVFTCDLVRTGKRLDITEWKEEKMRGWIVADVIQSALVAKGLN